MSCPVPLAVVGAGRVAHAVHLPLLARMPDLFRVVAIVDPDRSRAAKAAAGFPGAAIVDDLDDAFVAGARALLCTSPWYSHAGIVRRARRHRVPVLCEKPVTLDPDDLAELATTGGSPVAVGYMKRHDGAVQALLDHIRSDPGSLRHVTIRVVDPNAPHQVQALLPAGFPVADSSAADGARRALYGALGPVDDVVRECYAHPLGGSLVHQGNLLNAMLDGTGHELAGSLASAVPHAAGRSVSCTWLPSPSLSVQASYVHVPDSRVYAETVECVTTSEMLVLRGPSPYSADNRMTLQIVGHDAAGGEQGRTVRGPESGFARQLRAWAADLADGGDRLPGLDEAVRDLAVVREAVEALR